MNCCNWKKNANNINWTAEKIQNEIFTWSRYSLSWSECHTFSSLHPLSSFVSTDVNNEDKSVVVFNFLHCRLSCEGIFEDLVLVKLVPGRGTNARVLGISFLLQCPWPVKCNWCSYFLGFLLKSPSTWFHCLGSLLGLGFWVSLLWIQLHWEKITLSLVTKSNNIFWWM